MKLVSKLLLFLGSLLVLGLDVALSLFDCVLEPKGVILWIVRSDRLENDSVLTNAFGQLAPDLVRLAFEWL